MKGDEKAKKAQRCALSMDTKKGKEKPGEFKNII